MPMNLVLVRHGESEGNRAKSLSKKSEGLILTDEFKNRHSSSFRLTNRGREQAKNAGEWIKKNIGASFFRYYVSEYVRAIETAAYLDLPDAKWFCDFYLRERDWGELDIITEEERATKFADEMRRRELDPFFWAPPGGESVAQLCLRVDRVLHTLHRECDRENVIMVCHGETMWAFRVRLERMSQERYRELCDSEDIRDRILNCQILHYTRRNPPREGGYIEPCFSWMRSVCPTDTKLSRNDWGAIERPSYTNEELLEIAEKSKRIIE